MGHGCPPADMKQLKVFFESIAFWFAVVLAIYALRYWR